MSNNVVLVEIVEILKNKIVEMRAAQVRASQLANYIVAAQKEFEILGIESAIATILDKTEAES